jgi:hypothetical protein
VFKNLKERRKSTMKKFISLVFALMLTLCTVGVSFAETVTLDQREFSVTYEGMVYDAYFDRVSLIGDPNETGICYITHNYHVIAVLDYWYKEGEVVRIYGFSDFLLGPKKLTQIIYGIELNEKFIPIPQ